jgi:hypothetical protein
LIKQSSRRNRVPVFVAVYFKSKKTAREQLRFVPRCSDCGTILFDVAKANLAVVEGSPSRLKRIGTHEGAEVFRQVGRACRAFLFCWKCDSKQGGNVPWLNALSTFRGLDEPQRFPEAEYVGKPR